MKITFFMLVVFAVLAWLGLGAYIEGKQDAIKERQEERVRGVKSSQAFTKEDPRRASAGSFHMGQSLLYFFPRY